MADTKDRDPNTVDAVDSGDGNVSDNSSTIDAQTYAYSEDRKIGVTGAVFLIINKMIGTGSEPLQTPSISTS